MSAPTITSYGYSVPATGDGSRNTGGWMPGYEFNMNRLNGHSHNGQDSALLTINAFTPYTQTALIAGWGSPTLGVYTQLLTAPVGIADINSYNPQCVIASGANTGKRVALQINRVSATTFNLLCNDNTIDVLIVWR